MAVVSRVEIALDSTRAAANAKKFGRSMDGVANATRDVNGRLRDAKGRFLGAGNAANKASGGIGKLAGSLVKASAAYLTVSQAIQATNRAVNESVSRASSVRSLELLSSQYGETSQLQEAATKSAQKFGLSLTQVNKDLASTYARLRPVGVGLEDIESVFNGFNTAARLSGASASESAGAFRQLAQALGSGVLRGDEFNSIAEQAPGLLIAISKETGQAVGALRNYAADGKITADIVVKALKRIETEGAESLAKALDTPAQKLVNLQNATENLNVAFGDLILPAVIGLVERLAIATEGLTDDVEKTQQAFKLLNAQLQIFKPLIEPLEETIKSLGIEFDEFFLNIAEGVPVAGTLIKQLRLLIKLRDLAAGAQDVIDRQGTDLRPEQGAAIDFDKINAFREQLKAEDLLKNAQKSGSGTQDKAAESAARIAKASADRVQSLENQTLLASALTQEELRQFQNQIEIKKLLENKQGLTKVQLNAELEALTNLQAQVKATQQIKEENAVRLQQAEDLKEKEKALAEAQAAAAEKLQGIYDQIGQSIASGVVDTLSAAVDQTKSLADAAANTLRNVASILLKLGVNTALQSTGLGIFSGLAGFANGGRPPVGKPSIVGERGPELFVPNTSGTIVPNGKFGGGGGATNVVVNVDAKGSSASGDSGAGKQLGGLIGAAVQAELIKQQRPGGLLSR